MKHFPRLPGNFETDQKTYLQFACSMVISLFLNFNWKEKRKWLLLIF